MGDQEADTESGCLVADAAYQDIFTTSQLSSNALPIKGHPTLHPMDIAISTSGISVISLLC